MKKYISLLIGLTLITSCEKNVIGEFEELEANYSSEEVANKKGVAFTNNTQRWSHRTSDLGAHWMYSWGNTLREEIPDNVEFVPMFWGAGSVTQINIDRMIQFKNEDKIKYILGFNEPDGAEQANMTVDQAIALWPSLEQIGLPLVSPATVNPNNAWMQEFMQRADELNLRVDYVAVHHYGGDNVLAFVNKLKQTYEAYGRPIWVTEFAVADWNAASPEANRYSEEQVAAFMEEALVALDAIDWVFRYSWFDGRNTPLFTSALFNEENTTLTSAGHVYAGNNPNYEVGLGIDTEFVIPPDEDELLTNGGFETGQIAPWAGFKNDVVGPASTEPYAGNFCGRIKNGDGSLLYIVDVEPNTDYTLKFYSKWNEAVSNTFNGVIRNDDGNDLLFALPSMPQTTEWEEMTYQFTIPDGVTRLKLIFYKGQGFPPFFMDNVSLKLTE